MNKPQRSHLAQEQDTLVSRFGLRVAAGLTEQGEQLSQDVSERLRFAREQALLKARNARAAQPQLATEAVQQGGASLALRGPGGGWLKLASLLPLLLLVLGLLLIQHSQWYQQITAAAEVDAALLSDQLPPAAYGDPGFREYLSDEEQAQQPPEQQQQAREQK